MLMLTTDSKTTMMIHCGNPITYADLTRSYWQQHFYGFGRIPYDP